jgi:hypothetical protein
VKDGEDEESGAATLVKEKFTEWERDPKRFSEYLIVDRRNLSEIDDLMRYVQRKFHHVCNIIDRR